MGRRPQVLADRDDVDADRAQVGERVDDLVVGLAHADDDPRLRDETRSLRPGRARRDCGRSQPMDARLAAGAAPSRGCGSARRDARRRSPRARPGHPCSPGSAPRPPRPACCARIASIVATNALGAAVGEVVTSDRGHDRVRNAHALAPPRRRARGSLGSSATGWLVSTRQKPHARVHDAPLIMKVAVPSAQHSDRFGQPASSQTVTSPSSRIVWRSPRTPRSCFTCAAQPLGLACFDLQALGDARLREPARQPHRLARAMPAAEERESSGRSRHATSWRSHPCRAPSIDGQSADDVDDRGHVDCDALGCERRHALVGDAARNDVPEHRQIGRRRSARSRASSGRVTSARRSPRSCAVSRCRRRARRPGSDAAARRRAGRARPTRR